MHLRHATAHDVLACWFGVDRAAITRAIGGYGCWGRSSTTPA
ncbi:hypothetical protein ACQEV4_25310 [Streptomyces shenzhenensis]